MGMQGNEAEVFFRMRRLMFELVPLVKEAADFPNPFGGNTDTEPVFFPKIDGSDVSFNRKANTVTLIIEPTKNKGMLPGRIGWEL